MRHFWIRITSATLLVCMALTQQCWPVPPGVGPANSKRTVYVLDHEQSARDFAAATTDEERRALLDKRWESIKRAIAHCDVGVIVGDFTGLIGPTSGDGSLLNLEIRGFAPAENIQAIDNCIYTQFKASIANSNCEPGIYPRQESLGLGARRIGRNNNWVIHRQVDKQE